MPKKQKITVLNSQSNNQSKYLTTLLTSCALRKIKANNKIRPTVIDLIDDTKSFTARRNLEPEYGVAFVTERNDAIDEETDESQSSESIEEKARRKPSLLIPSTNQEKTRKRTNVQELKHKKETPRKHKRITLQNYWNYNDYKQQVTTQGIPEYYYSTNDMQTFPSNMNIARIDDFVYTFVNTTIENGQKSHRVIIYNKTHYLPYTGNVIPKDYVQLYKLWKELRGAKVFDAEFQVPSWMQWHKPPWWMDWHKPPLKATNDSWDLWNQPGMQPPTPFYDKSNDPAYSNLTNWLRQLYSKVSDIQINSWKKIPGDEPNMPFDWVENDAPSRGAPSTSFSGNNYVHFHLSEWLKDLWNKVTNTRRNNRRFLDQEQKKPKSRRKEEDVDTTTSRWQTDLHNIKDQKEINTFTKQILDSILTLLGNLRNSTDEYRWQMVIKHISTLYEEKYKQFLRDTRNQKIKSDQGTHKVILNAIDMSDRILTRLYNVKIEEVAKLGLEDYVNISNTLQSEIRNEKFKQLNRACSELGICRAGSGIIQLLLDVLRLMLTSDDQKFKQAFTSLAETAKTTDFREILHTTSDEVIKKVIEKIESRITLLQRTYVMILRNIIDKRNTPLTVLPDVDSSRNGVMMTLAIQEIFNKIDEQVPNTAENVATWNKILKDMDSWAREDTPDVREIMHRLVSNIKYSIDSLDEESYHIIVQNVNKIIK